MTYQKAKEEIIESSPQKTDAGKEELYLYSLRKMAEENVENNRTGLTNLHNINSFFYLCGEMIKQQPDKKYSVIIMDIVQFKAVNEFCGRDEGDRLLRFIASCFDWYENNRPDSYACHIRADIFCLCTSYEEVEELEIIVREIRKKITDFPFAYRVQPSFGIGISPERAPAISYLKDCATMAMNSIKGKVYRTYAVFDEKMRSQKMRERQVENDIVSALENGELQLYVQPKVDMRDGRVIGGEALVRWKHPEKGLVPPGEFIPVLEKNGFIINVDEYIWEKVFAYLGKLRKEGRTLIPVSINVSRLHAYDEKLTETLLRLREEYDVLPEYVPLELTESAFLEDEVGMYRRMESLRERGFLVSMDDFGTGYSTMNMLKNQTLDEIKIDQVVIGSCTNGRLSDLRIAANLLKGKKVAKNVRCIVFPGTQTIYLDAMREGLVEAFIQAGAVVSTPTCCPCLGGHMGILAAGERAVSTTNRNFVGRMGHVDSEVYLASPAVAAASAVTGYITDPAEVSGIGRREHQ